MVADQHTQDPQDKQFGTKASADQEFVDQLEDEGVELEDLPDTPSESVPRAGGKAEPAD